MEFVIGATGRTRCLYTEEINLETLGPLKIRRASNVETTDGGWTADLSPVGGPNLGPFARRSEALRAETNWIEAHLPTIAE